MNELNTHNYRLKSGRHRGHLITRVPRSYLHSLVKNVRGESDYAQAELDRRGVSTPTVDISAHAIDRASQKLLKQWRKTRQGDEGLHAWLSRLSTEAMLHYGRREGHLAYAGVVFDIAPDGAWPTVRTVWRDGHTKGGA